MGYAEAKPEATPIQAEGLLHFGDRAAVDELVAAQAVLPRWMAEPLSRRIAHA